MRPAVAVLLLVAAGYPAAYLLTRRPLLAALIAPMVTAVTASLAVAGMLLTGGRLPAGLAGLAGGRHRRELAAARADPGRPQRWTAAAGPGPLDSSGRSASTASGWVRTDQPPGIRPRQSGGPRWKQMIGPLSSRPETASPTPSAARS
jgi:hypothetical protein